MTMSLQLLSESASGAIFGAALLLSGVYVPHIIQAQMLFHHSHMLQVFLGGSATSAIVLDIAHRTHTLRKQPRAPSNLGLCAYDGNVLGGALIGLGMAATGACPGTGLVQLGTGMANGVLVVVGGVLGAWVFLRVRALLLGEEEVASVSSLNSTTPTTTTAVHIAAPRTDSPPSPTTTSTKSLDIPTALAIQPLSVLLFWIPMCLAVIALAHFLDRPHFPYPTAGLIFPAYGGLLIGIAQAATVLFTHHHIGASTAYEDLARWIAHKLSAQQKDDSASHPPPLMTPSMTFATGIVSSVAILKFFVLGSQLAPTESFPASLPAIARTVAGGASMVFGARLAGGCTSGHGISGLAKFSLASLATTCAIFGGGMLSARILSA